MKAASRTDIKELAGINLSLMDRSHRVVACERML